VYPPAQCNAELPESPRVQVHLLPPVHIISTTLYTYSGVPQKHAANLLSHSIVACRNLTKACWCKAQYIRSEQPTNVTSLCSELAKQLRVPQLRTRSNMHMHRTISSSGSSYIHANLVLDGITIYYMCSFPKSPALVARSLYEI
jgi:hypothetical protein